MKIVWRWIAYSLLAAHFAVVLTIWLTTSLELFRAGAGSTLLSLAQLAGLLAAACALLQFMLMGRSPWIERAFGLERIAKLHRLNGYATISLILTHTTLVTLGYAALTGSGLIPQFTTFLTKFNDVIYAFIAELLFLTIVGSSIYIVRRRLPYERWYWVHLMVYLAIVLAFFHQTKVGGSFLSQPAYIVYWYALYGFVALNVFTGRLFLPAYNYWRFRFAIDEIVPETADTVSIYIHGRGLERFRARPGQFVIIWLPQAKLWLEEHPFSLSGLPHDGRLRLTVKAVGDYTSRLPKLLKSGAPVVIAGPYGQFTPAPTARPRRLYLAGGVGITPLRTLLEAQTPEQESVLIYGNKTPADTIFADELAQLATRIKLRIHHVYSEAPTYAGETGRIDTARIERLVPDFRDREVYLCGPPPMMAGLAKGLIAAGLAPARLHYERFALHPVSS
ncbi:MAG TPA: ferredoxin reductase family protein [Candidatus Saccharimonadia bacterium]|nr:ferredoxin reductase family protein [Candidatus Saccharimonadia bacterium]